MPVLNIYPTGTPDAPINPVAALRDVGMILRIEISLPVSLSAKFQVWGIFLRMCVDAKRRKRVGLVGGAFRA